MTSARRTLIVGFWAICIVLTILWLILRSPRPSDSPSQTAGPATTRPASGPTELAAKPPRSYVDVVHLTYPALPATQPFAVPVELREAAHLILRQPVYLDRSGFLWITHPAAEPTELVLRNARREQVNLVRERVAFVHWFLNDAGTMRPMLICQAGNGWELVDGKRRTPFPTGQKYDWTRAFSWNGRIVAPTDNGASVFTVSDGLKEQASGPLVDGAGAHAPMQVLLDWQGILAWVPPQDGQPGSAGAMRYRDDRWIKLGAAQGWPANILHLIPLLDGSVLQIVDGGGEKVRLSIVALDTPAADRGRIEDLAAQLSDDDPDKRKMAYQELTRYGPGAWPVLEKLLDQQPPEARNSLQQLLHNRSEPTLGGIKLVDGRMRLVCRHSDGGVLFYAQKGVTIPSAQQDAQVVAPAWISIRPGEAVQLLAPQLAKLIQDQPCRIDAWAGEWIVTDEGHGPQQFIGNGLQPLLRKNERDFSELVGIDSQGRWLFRKPANSSTRPADQQTLIIDPTLPDPVPHLPAWDMVINNGTVGWDAKGRPAIRSGGAWALDAESWQALNDQNERMYTSLAEMPPSTAPTTSPASAPAGETEPPLLVTADGARYYGGRDDLRLVTADGRRTVWPLPPKARGSGPATLLRTADGVLFLFNQPGRVLRIRPTDHGAEPFALEASFTRRIPTATPDRIWLDPQGRIIIAYEQNKLAILFPQGHIPRPILLLMPRSQLEAEEDQQNP